MVDTACSLQRVGIMLRQKEFNFVLNVFLDIMNPLLNLTHHYHNFPVSELV